MNKKDSRIIAKDRISKLTDSEKEWASDSIIDAISNLDEFKKSKKIFIFINNEFEPNTHEIIGLSLMMEKTVAVPKIDGLIMNAIVITPFTNFKVNKFGIEEPVSNEKIDDIDLVIVPMLAFNNVNRVGHGKGYYDKFLTNYNCTKIGIAFSCQEMENIEFEENDIPLDMIITERNIISVNKREDNKFGV